MNLQKTIVTSMIALLVVALSASIAAAYTIDGDLDDWGISVNTGGNWSQTATWVPVGHERVQFQIEDNVDPDSVSDWRGDNTTPAYATGVHIIGNSSSYSVYDEPRVVSGGRAGWAFPTGATNQSAEQYDMEAMYVDEDANNLYFAIVLSCSANSYASDLGLDITPAVSGDGYAYEYGIVIHNDSAGIYAASNRDIISVSDWSDCTTVTECSPYKILGGTPVGTETAMVAYAKNGPDPEPNGDYPATYIIEGEIPKSIIGTSTSVSLHYTVHCGNDEIIIQKSLEPPEEPPEEQVPVFTPSGIIALIGMLCVIGMSRIGKRFN
ncbi:MAG: hypothetical protein C4B59_16970 [Candidatus Methanogaster sp.]|uniref:Uncharacterized protein n=1 Tax=Candidatus Methanogaster sp. TaxID=3386292 RepID=A0AC61KY31_9EURY|nr:MAG: hypothetical protein C4B59_16970 [ANME-2 cluster archaeon]